MVDLSSRITKVCLIENCKCLYWIRKYVGMIPMPCSSTSCSLNLPIKIDASTSFFKLYFISLPGLIANTESINVSKTNKRNTDIQMLTK